VETGIKNERWAGTEQNRWGGFRFEAGAQDCDMTSHWQSEPIESMKSFIRIIRASENGKRAVVTTEQPILSIQGIHDPMSIRRVYVCKVARPNSHLCVKESILGAYSNQCLACGEYGIVSTRKWKRIEKSQPKPQTPI
jgi:hypothetical protein